MNVVGAMSGYQIIDQIGQIKGNFEPKQNIQLIDFSLIIFFLKLIFGLIFCGS